VQSNEIEPPTKWIQKLPGMGKLASNVRTGTWRLSHGPRWWAGMFRSYSFCPHRFFLFRHPLSTVALRQSS